MTKQMTIVVIGSSRVNFTNFFFICYGVSFGHSVFDDLCHFVMLSFTVIQPLSSALEWLGSMIVADDSHKMPRLIFFSDMMHTKLTKYINWTKGENKT